MYRPSLQRLRTAKQPVTVNNVRALASRYGLTITGPRTSHDLMARRVAWIVEDLAEEPFNEPIVPWSTVLAFLASEDGTAATRLLEYDYTSPAAHREAAEWFLTYVLNHLDGSGLSVVRLCP